MRSLLEPNVQICKKWSYPKKKQYHLQSLEAFLRKLEPLKMPHPPFHMEKEGVTKVW
jgi:hypothetical protein